MRISVFSDVHGNQEALEAFIEHSSARDIDMYVCLGDIVGYGASPNECLAMVRLLPNVAFVLGNHDAAAAEQTSPYDMNRDATRAMLWTMEALSPENVSFLKSLEPTLKMGHMLFSHANPYNPLNWDYVFDRPYAARSFARTKERLLFVGHTHVSSFITRQSFFKIFFERPEENAVLCVDEGKRRIINCGSVGQPRDGDPRAAYAVYDTESDMVEFHRVPYDHEKAAEKIRAEGLPESLALRLFKGV